MDKTRDLWKLISLVCLMPFVFSVQAGQENIRFQHLNLEQGLSQEWVQAIHQDSQGYMWFGTQEGLNRYDGYHFKVFSHDDRIAGSLTDDWIYSIAEADDGKLWVGTENGVSVLEPASESFSHFHHHKDQRFSLSHNRVRVIFKDKQGTIWLGTERGLNRFEEKQQRFYRYYGEQDLGVPVTDIRDITEDNNGHLWIASMERGLCQFDPEQGQFRFCSAAQGSEVQLSTSRISTLFFNGQKRLWIGSDGYGVIVLDLDTFDSIEHKHVSENGGTISSDVVKDIYKDNQGRIWLTTGAGLNRWSEDQQRFYSIKHEPESRYSLSDNNLTKVFMDRGGVLWVGSYAGLNKWNTATAAFNHYRVTSEQQQSLSSNGVNAFFQSAPGQLWVGTYGGLNLIEQNTGQITQYRHQPDDPNSLSSDKIMSLYARNSQELWLGTRDRGLDHFDLKTGKVKNYSYKPDQVGSLGANAVSAILGADEQRIWIGTFGGGLNLFDPSTEVFAQYRHDESDLASLSSDRVLSLSKDSAGMLWVGTWGAGVNLFNPQTGKALRLRNDVIDASSLSSDIVWSTHEDKEGNIWLGTTEGVSMLSAQNRAAGRFEFERITRREGLPSKVVYGILEDDSGHLWFSTNRGLSKYSPVSKSMINYDSSHGLQGNEFNAGAFYKTADGQLLFGGTNGVTAFRPEQIRANSHVPPVVLTRFMKLNEAVPLTASSALEAIEVGYSDYLIAFEFAGLDYASPDNNQYRYQLQGFDQEWLDAEDLRRATYTNLPAGDYRFVVKASNNDGVWNQEGVSVALRVLPAPWFSWWAYLVYASVVLLLIVLTIRAYLKKISQQSRYRLKLEREVASRTAELRTLNQQLLDASVTDTLTGLHNRRYLAEHVEEQCNQILAFYDANPIANKRRADRAPRLFFMMVDLDGLKPLNDNYGHAVGDSVISMVATLLRQTCRGKDTVIRWGGDEFLIMGELTDVNEVEHLASQLNEVIAHHPFDIGLKNAVHLSCSIGFSLFPFAQEYPRSLSWEQVQIVADQALYESKLLGRNRWTGLLSGQNLPPSTLMSTLTSDLPGAIEEGMVLLREPPKQYLDPANQRRRATDQAEQVDVAEESTT